MNGVVRGDDEVLDELERMSVCVNLYFTDLIQPLHINGIHKD